MKYEVKKRKKKKKKEKKRKRKPKGSGKFLRELSSFISNKSFLKKRLLLLLRK